MNTTSDRLWSVQDVAVYLGIPLKTLYNWRTRGIGPRARRVGRYLRYEEQDVRAWFTTQSETVR
jgi:predicted DNA-binding transcriptional regulator AlpA